MNKKLRRLVYGATALVVGWCSLNALPAHSQSGRQKNTNVSPSPTPTRPRHTTKTMPAPPVMPTSARSNTNDSASESDEVVRVSSHLVPVPATVLDARGAAVPNLRIEDFELTVDGVAKVMRDIYRAETPVGLAMVVRYQRRLGPARE